MLSEHLQGVLEHKRQVGRFMRTAAHELFQIVIAYGDVLPYTLETDEPATLFFLIDVACKLKRDAYGSRFALSEQVSRIVSNTVDYLEKAPGSTPSHWRGYILSDLFRRAIEHDDSKFAPEEFDTFERMTPILKTLTYGSDDYKEALKELGPALQHHYKVNSHHPEHFTDGINDMNLIDDLEMVCDWTAATQRVKDGDIFKSLEINTKRFGIDQEHASIIQNTIHVLLKPI